MVKKLTPPGHKTIRVPAPPAQVECDPVNKKRKAESAARDSKTWSSKGSNASDDAQARGATPRAHPALKLTCHEQPVIDGQAYPVLNHWIEATKLAPKPGGKHVMLHPP